MTSLESLPEAWLRQLALVLPKHLKLRLRCCSTKLQACIDHLGVGIVAQEDHPPVLALQLAAQHLTSLNTLQLHLPPPTADSAQQDAVPHAQLAAGVRRLPCGLPALRRLTINLLQQPDLLSAVLDSRPTSLTHLKLCDRHQGVELSPQDLQQRCHVLLSLPGLATALVTLELDHRTYRLAEQPVQAALQQPLPHLRALILHPKLVDGRAAGCTPVVGQSAWSAVFQPLLSTLTRLDIGSRQCTTDAAAADAADSSQGGVAAAAAEGSSSGLQHLLQLRCSGLDGPVDQLWNLSWVGACCSLTAMDISLCSAGEIDWDVLGQLQQLQSLAVHYYEDEFVRAAALGPLSACCKLTQLKLDALLLEVPAADTATAAAAEGVSAANMHAAAGAGASAAAVVAGGAGAPHPARLPQLTSLQRLTAGLMCNQAPLSLLAPNLTRLIDADYDLGVLDLPGGFVSETQPAGQEALAGLAALQVLNCNIFALVRHAAQPRNLLGLHELHVDMVGSLEGSCLDPAGLPCLPQLTRLVMSMDTKVHRRLDRTYSTSEDVLLWRHQSNVRELRLRGSVLLGGFMVDVGLLQQLPSAMPALQRVELVKPQGLRLQQLHRFVAAGVCGSVLVLQVCGSISDRECAAVQQQAGEGGTTVEYST